MRLNCLADELADALVQIMGLIDGKALSQQIISSLKTVSAALPQAPSLAIVQVGSREDSSLYIRNKIRSAAAAGVEVRSVHLPDSTSESALLSQIAALNQDAKVHGIIVQLPLPEHIRSSAVASAISPYKDVDAFHPHNTGMLHTRNAHPLFVPCTPRAVMALLEFSKTPIAGAFAVVVGRSNIVGTPTAALLQQANATVALAHSKTRNLGELLKQADIIVSAAGNPDLIPSDCVKSGATIIDVSTNQIPDASRKSGSRWVGDADFVSLQDRTNITPVPGGVGPVTVAMLLSNTVLAAKRFFNGVSHALSPLPLNIVHPTPPDNQIESNPKHISVVAREIGILPHELIHSNNSAKISLSVAERLAHRKNAFYVLISGITPTPLGEGKSTTAIGLAQSLSAHLKLPSIACLRQPSQGPTFGIKGGAAGGGYSQIIPMEALNLHLTGDIHAVTAANNLLAAAIDARMFHEATQSDEALYDRLVPFKNGVRTQFAPVMLRRLKKLGIEKTDPNELTPEERSKFVRLNIDPATITWHRVIDTNDRFLRRITIGQGPQEKGHTRETSFDISVASEIMAILALTSDLADMRERLGRMVVASNTNGEPVTADDLGVGGALAALMKDAINPTLLQTIEGTPVLIHAGPFANIAHGNSSIIADRIALKLVGSPSPSQPPFNPSDHADEAPIPTGPQAPGYVITEAGFGADIGMEKFFNIKCRASGFSPNVIVLVATIRALKMHGGGPQVVPGKPLPDAYSTENLDLLQTGCDNMVHHIKNATKYGVPVIVCVNQFSTDTQAEIDMVCRIAKQNGAADAVASSHHRLGGAGAIDLANAVVKTCTEHPDTRVKYLYDVDKPILDKLATICREMYGARGVVLTPAAEAKIAKYTQQGYDKLPVCIAKTHLSITHDVNIKNVPREPYDVVVRDLKMSVGAGFVYALLGDVQTMPGLSTRPGFYDVEVDTESGKILGLF